jgi:hypothetical protein
MPQTYPDNPIEQLARSLPERSKIKSYAQSVIPTTAGRARRDLAGLGDTSPRQGSPRQALVRRPGLTVVDLGATELGD